MLDKVLKLLEEKHGKKPDLKEGEVFYLFLGDGLFSLYLEEDTKTLKVDVEFLDREKTFIYFGEEKLEDLMDV